MQVPHKVLFGRPVCQHEVTQLNILLGIRALLLEAFRIAFDVAVIAHVGFWCLC